MAFVWPKAGEGLTVFSSLWYTLLYSICVALRQSIFLPWLCAREGWQQPCRLVVLKVLYTPLHCLLTGAPLIIGWGSSYFHRFGRTLLLQLAAEVAVLERGSPYLWLAFMKIASSMLSVALRASSYCRVWGHVASSWPFIKLQSLPYSFIFSPFFFLGCLLQACTVAVGILVCI